MKVYIGPYLDWFGPYQLAEKILFWMNKDTDDRVHNFGRWLAGDSKEFAGLHDENKNRTVLYRLMSWVHEKRKRTIKVRIDKYDTWSMDSTLSLIVLPMLKQLQKTKHGAPFVDDEDVPEEIRSTSAPPKENDWDTDENHFKRWDWVLNEMIFAFESDQPDNDWEAQFRSGKYDFVWKKSEHTYMNPDTGKEEFTYEMSHGDNHTAKLDEEGYKKYADRIQNGFRLFGKYYQGLWD